MLRDRAYMYLPPTLAYWLPSIPQHCDHGSVAMHWLIILTFALTSTVMVAYIHCSLCELLFIALNQLIELGSFMKVLACGVLLFLVLRSGWKGSFVLFLRLLQTHVIHTHCWQQAARNSLTNSHQPTHPAPFPSGPTYIVCWGIHGWYLWAGAYEPRKAGWRSV